MREYRLRKSALLANTMARNKTSDPNYSLTSRKTYDDWRPVRGYEGSGGIGYDGGHVVNPNPKYCADLGNKYDEGTELTYMRARYYEAATGRFISEDPARQGWNWFIYCGNNPAERTDATGKYWTKILGDFKFLVEEAAGRLHIHIFEKGSEVWSRQVTGAAWHVTGGDGLPRKVLDAIVTACKTGNSDAMNIAKRLIQGGFGLSDDVIKTLRSASGLGVAAFAISSLDAYMQVEPADFFDTLKTIGMAYSN